MKLIELIRLVLKHKVLLFTVPILLAGIVILLTSNPRFSYASQSILYTGLASGSTIEMDKPFNYLATNTAFDNLINIINSRETQEEVAIRLLSQHLLLPESDPKYISSKFFAALKNDIPSDLNDYVYTDKESTLITDSLLEGAPNNRSKNDQYLNGNRSDLFPSSINKLNYEKTVENLTALMKSSNSNFVYLLLNYDHEHYSIKAISKVKPQRLGNSDLIKLNYEVNDPGICQQTLAIYNEVCIKKYKKIKENRSDAVVKYFESQLILAKQKLKEAENTLLNFNKSYNIINYYEQSKAVAIVKEDMEMNFINKKAQLAGTEAATLKLEEKLNIQQHVQLKSNNILEKKKKLGELNYEIAIAEAELNNDANIKLLKEQSESLKKEIKQSVDELYTHQNTVEGLPITKILPEWIDNVIVSENLKAKIEVMGQQNKDFQKQYAVYAPAGANIKRIEREISVSEQGYLEILHGLNLAKLKSQDNELSSNLKTVDPPYYPISPISTKRKLIIIASALIGFIFILGIILLMEYFDDSLKNSKRASKKLKLSSLGMFPKIILDTSGVNLTFIQDRLTQIISQKIQQFINSQNSSEVNTILVLSTRDNEGKTIIAGNIAKSLITEGKKVLLLNYDETAPTDKRVRKYPNFNRILGYSDNRIDYDNIALSDRSKYLNPENYETFTIDQQFYKVKNYREILDQNNIIPTFKPDYVIIELPSLIYHNYPAKLVSNANMSLLICRSNRLWSESDNSALNRLQELSATKVNFVVNGVELKEVESLLGDLPKRPKLFRTRVKNILKFQFFNKNQI